MAHSHSNSKWSASWPAPEASAPIAKAVSRRGRFAGAARRVVAELFAHADIRLDGTRAWDLRIHHAGFYQRVLSGGTLGLGEAYLDGWWDCDAIDEMCCRALRARLAERVPRNLAGLAATAAAVLFNLQSAGRSRKAVAAHYDLGNDFFAAMLDPTLQYSCAYYAGTADLAEAQRLKLDLICRKLGLQPGQRLLDIGCGWGGLAKYAAANHGCRVVGITLSREQQAYATEQCRGLPVEIRLQDYRDVAGEFDHVVSVGMMEHVGYKNYGAYMAAAARCLRPAGLFLCHTIGSNASQVRSDPWLNKYIFPDSMLPSPAQVARAAEGRFVLEDVHNFGPHYDLTLLAWERNFRRSWDRFRHRYGGRFGRMWRYYLLSCAGAFRAREIELFQFVLSKGGVPGGYRSVR